MSQSRKAMSGSYDDWQISSTLDNSNTFSDEIDSILMSNWNDDASQSMMLDWPFDDQKILPDSSQIGEQVPGLDPSLEASQDGMASGTKGVNFPRNDTAPLSDMFASHLELDKSIIDPELFKRSPVLIPDYTVYDMVPVSPGSTYQFPATTAPFPSPLSNDDMYENSILQMFSSEPPQDLSVPAQKQTDSLMMEEEEVTHPGEPTAARREETCKETLQGQRSTQSIKTDHNGVAGLGHLSTTISDRKKGAADIVPPPTRGTSAVNDGYNWRKYGQKNVKDHDCPRSYYKCTHPSCKVTKKEQRDPQGSVSEIIYKGDHNHPQPNPSPSNSSHLEHGAPLKALQQNNQEKELNATEIMRSPSRLYSRQVKYLVAAFSDSDNINDGYRWRKYGSKVVKGNSNPRGYYRCTDSSGCTAKKLVERSPDDFKKLMTTYEGTHKHEVPGPKNKSIGSSARSSVLPQANGSLAPRSEPAAQGNLMGTVCPNLVSLPRSLPDLPAAAANTLSTVVAAPLPCRRKPILPQLSSYSGFSWPLQPGIMTMMMPKLEPMIQPPPSKRQLALPPNGDGTAIYRPLNIR